MQGDPRSGGGDEVHDTAVSDTVQAQPVERHQPWCDLRQHELAEADAMGQSGCVGRYIRHGAVGGWVAEDVPDQSADAPEQGAGARLVVDWRPAEGWNSLRPEEAAELSGLLTRLLAEHRRPAGTRRRYAWARRKSV